MLASNFKFFNFIFILNLNILTLYFNCIFNLYFFSKKFTTIFSTKYSSVFKPLNRVCNEEIWVDILSHNFSGFLNTLRDELKDDLEIYFYLSYRFHSFIFNNLFLYSVFVHFTLCKRRCGKKERYELFCNFPSQITSQIFNKEYSFNDIIINERDFSREFNFFFFFFKSLFSLDICRSHALFINTKKVKIFGCTYFEDIKTSNNFFRALVSILLRVYLNYILSLLNEVEFREYQATFFRQEV